MSRQRRDLSDTHCVVYRILVGPGELPPESITLRLGSHSPRCHLVTSRDRGSIVQAVQESAVRQLLQELSQTEKRTLLEAILGVSLSRLTEGLGVPETPPRPVRADEPRAEPRLLPPALTPSPEPLSRREQEVAAFIARGLSNREIADVLVLSVRTVEAHVTHVLTKLGLRSRAQVAVWAAHYLEPPVASVQPLRITSVESAESGAPWQTRRSQPITLLSEVPG